MLNANQQGTTHQNTNHHSTVHRFGTRRRSFLKALALSATGVALAPFARLAIKKESVLESTETDQPAVGSSQPRVFIFQDKAHFGASFNIAGSVQPYRAPKVAASTKDYVNKTDQITFLQRHWFA